MSERVIAHEELSDSRQTTNNQSREWKGISKQLEGYLPQMTALNWYLVSHDLSVKYVINIYVNIFNVKLSYFLKLGAPAPNWRSGCELGAA